MSANLLVKAARTGRTIARVTPQSAGWRYVGFEALWLAPEETYTGKTGGSELCVVVVAGHVTVESGDLAFRELGERASPFEDLAPQRLVVRDGRRHRCGRRAERRGKGERKNSMFQHVERASRGTRTRRATGSLTRGVAAVNAQCAPGGAMHSRIRCSA